MEEDAGGGAAATAEVHEVKPHQLHKCNTQECDANAHLIIVMSKTIIVIIVDKALKGAI